MAPDTKQASAARILGPVGSGRRKVLTDTIIAIEQGRHSPSLEMALRIAKAFNVPLDEVFHYPEEMS
jgi:putative transcriptional regulator